MAVIGVKSITGITSITNAAGGADVLTFHSNNTTERVRIDSDGRLMVGTTTPGNSSADDLTLHNSGNCGVTIRAGNSSNSYIFFADGTSSDEPYRGFISYFHNGDFFKFGTAGTERVRIDSDGRLRIGNTTQNQYTAADDLIVGSGSGDRGLTIYSGSSDAGVIAFSDGTTDTAYRSGQIIYDHSANAMDFRTNGNYIRLKLTSTGQLEATSAADVRLTLGSSGTAGTNNSVHVRADSADLKFMAASGGTTIFETNGTETLRITSTGLVGINCTPNKQLEVKGTDVAFRLLSTVATGRIGMEFYDTSAQKGYFGYASSSNDELSIQQNEDADFWFYIGGGEKLRITTAGKIGIGHHSTSQIDNGKEFNIRPANDGGIRLIRPGDNISNPNIHLDITTTSAGSAFPSGEAYTVKYKTMNCDQIFETYAGGGTGGNISFRTSTSHNNRETLRITPDGHSYLAGRQYLTRSGENTVAGRSNLRETLFQAIAVGASHTFQISNTYGGGLVYVVGSRYANANIQTTKIYAIAIRTTANAHITSISSVNGQSGSFSFTVTGGSKGVTVANNDSTYSCNCFVTFDVTGFVG